MKKLVYLSAILAVISLTALMTGCGGGDDDDDNGGGGGAGQNFAPATLNNYQVTLTEGGQSRNVSFAVQGNTFTQFEPGNTNAVATGTFQWTRQDNDNGQLVLVVTPVGGASTNQVTYVLTFTSASGGTYTFSTSGGQTGSGTFSGLQIIPAGGGDGGGNGGGDGNGGGGGNGNGGGNGGGDGNGGGGNGGGTPGEPPTSLSGRVIDFSAAGLGNERLTFAPSGNTVTSDAINPPNNQGTYTYTAGTGTSPATLTVTFPNGDTYNLTMAFTDATHGSWSGSQFFDGSTHPVPAGSSFTIQP